MIRDQIVIAQLEQKTIEVGYELLNQVFRSSQKAIDRELQDLSKSYAALLKSDEKNDPKKIMSLQKKIAKYKLTIEKLYEDELSCYECLKRKISDIQSTDTTGKRFERLLIDHLLFHGDFDKAVILLKSSANDYSKTELDSAVLARTVDRDLSVGDLTSIKSWCEFNRVRLKKINSTLEYRIGLHEALSISNSDKIESIKFLTKNYKPQSLEQQELLQSCLGVMALPLLKNSQEFSNESLRKYFHLELARVGKNSDEKSLSIFQRIVMTGLSVLKTQHCKESDKSQAFHPNQTGHIPPTQNSIAQFVIRFFSLSNRYCQIATLPAVNSWILSLGSLWRIRL